VRKLGEVTFAKDTYLEIARENVKLFPWNGNTLNDTVLLPFKRDDCFVKDNSFVLFRVHPHQALHKILPSNDQYCQNISGNQISYPNFIPDVIIALEHSQVVLYWHNQAVAWNQLLM